MSQSATSPGHSPARRPSRGRPTRRRQGGGRPAKHRAGHPQHHSKGRRPGSHPKPPSALDIALAEAEAAPVDEGASFAALGLPERLVTTLARRGVEKPFPIQTRTIPDVIGGRHVLGRARTGSGKTLAFGLPMLARLSWRGRPRGRRAPRGLVLVPTRELAGQVRDVMAPLGQSLGLKVLSVYGGASMHRQVTALRAGVDVVVATPGRLLDLVGLGECSLEEIETTVLDEADYMTDLGFLPAITDVLDRTPAGGQRLLFSATLDRNVSVLVDKYLRDPAVHAVAPPPSAGGEAVHRAFILDHAHKLDVTAQVAAGARRTLVFVRTKHGADRLAKQLAQRGVRTGALHGNLRQNTRQRALDAFADGRSPVLVATDVAARGIHVDDVELVLHFDPPADAKDYLHRSGRTARAGASGNVLSLLMPDQVSKGRSVIAEAGLSPKPVRVDPGHAAIREVAGTTAR